MKLFDWSTIKDLDKYVISPKLNKAKRYVADYYRDLLKDKKYRESYYQYSEEWLEEFLEVDDEEKTDMILNTGFNKISPAEDPEKFNPFAGEWKKKNIDNKDGTPTKRAIERHYSLCRDWLEYIDLAKEYNEETELGYWILNHRSSCV